MSDKEIGFAWSDLSPTVRHALLEDPHGVIPAEYVPELVHSGGPVYASYWVASEEGPAGFRLSPSKADLIALLKEKMDRWWTDLPEHVRNVVTARKGRKIPQEHKGAIQNPNLVGGVLQTSAGGAEPTYFALAPFACDYVEWAASRSQ